MKKIVLLSLTLLMTLLFLTACGVPQKDYDKLASDLAAAQAQIQTLQAEKLQAEKEALRSQLDAAEAQIQSLKNQLAEAQSQNPSLQRREAETELANVQSAVLSMMVDNNLSILPSPVTTSTNDMSAFPDNSALGTGANQKGKDVLGVTYTTGDKIGYVLFQHDRIANGASGNLTNYVATQFTAYYYDVDAQGSVTQYTSAGN